MLYVKNLPAWERWGRGVAGFVLVVFGLAVFGGATQLAMFAGWTLAGIGAIAVLTGFVGFCPLCALVGRTPPIRG